MSELRVTHEPRVYALDSPHSWYADAIAAQNPGVFPLIYPGAQQRLDRYALELAQESHTGSPEGRRADRMIGDFTRTHDANRHEERARQAVRELRTLTTGGGATAAAASSASVFVSPYFLLDSWARFKGRNRAFADQCHTHPLPPYGMEVYLPGFASAPAVAQQTEGSPVTDTDPSSGFTGSNPIVTITGQIVDTQQFADRAGGPGAGGGFADTVIHQQLMEQLEESVDSYAVTTAISSASGSTVTNNTAWTANTLAPFYADQNAAREFITDTAGVRLRPTHLFSTSDFYSFVSAIMDTTGSPALPMPKFIPGAPPMTYTGADEYPAPKWSRFTGHVLPGGVLWFEDDNIPANGSDTQVIVSATDCANILLESPDPLFMAFPQTLADSLRIVCNLRTYACLIVRRAGGNSVITGSAYPSTDK